MSENTEACRLCPRNCGADRAGGQTGFCKVTDRIKVARAALHMWEEPCISGTTGSGTVFFSGCNIGCIFCQNKDISRGQNGIEIDPERLVEIYFELRDKGANNINLVTPTHYALQIRDSIIEARSRGFDLPFVYNTGTYESEEIVEELKPHIDIWLPDMKYFSPELSTKYSGCPDYFEVASRALAVMVRDTPCEFDSEGMMKRGVIVRHLVLPGETADSKKMLRYLHETYSDSIYISVMNQYTPVNNLPQYPQLMRRVTREEYDRVLVFAERIGIEKGFMQDGEVALESFIPAFNNEGVLKQEE